jgi:hypothetical protein
MVNELLDNRSAFVWLFMEYDWCRTQSAEKARDGVLECVIATVNYEHLLRVLRFGNGGTWSIAKKRDNRTSAKENRETALKAGGWHNDNC